MQGNSMMPMLPHGAVVHLEPVEPELLRVGDVVAARAPSGQRLLHRIRRVANRAPTPYLILQGDSTVFADPPVPFDWLEGRLARVKLPPEAGWRVPRPWAARLMAYTMTCMPASVGLRLRRAIGLLTLTSRILPETLDGALSVSQEATSPSSRPQSAMKNPQASGSDPSSENHNDPVHDERFHLQRVGDEWALHDRQTGELHLLNHTAAMIHLLRAKGRTVEEIVRCLRERYPDVSPDQLRNDVDLTLKKLTSLATRN